MKVFISFDMEGVAGIVDWSQCRAPGPAYEEGRALLLGEVNAAIDGALAGGATAIVANDSHGTMSNLPAERLHGRAAYISGRHKPLYMMEGLDGSFGAVLFVGYHGSISGAPSVLSHTYNPSVISGVTLNGTECGESGINALVAAAYGVPIALVSGDQVAVAEAAPFAAAGASLVSVKESITRFAAASLHPEAAREKISAAAALAVRGAAAMTPPPLERPVRLDVSMQTADLAELATWVRGAERTGTRAVRIETGDPLAAYRSFVAVTYITRMAEGR